MSGHQMHPQWGNGKGTRDLHANTETQVFAGGGEELSIQSSHSGSLCMRNESLQWVAFKTDGRQTEQVLKKELWSLDSVWGKDAKKRE